MTQAFTPKLCAFLSSLTPKFEGHYGYYKFYDDSVSVACHEEIWWIEKHRKFTQVRRKKPELICPAWQVEDVLRKLPTIRKLKYGPPIRMAFLPDLVVYIKPLGELVNAIEIKKEIYDRVTYHQMVISSFLIKDPDTAYQKIEEYLWSILT